MFSDIINVITVTSDQFIASLCNTIIKLFPQNNKNE